MMNIAIHSRSFEAHKFPFIKTIIEELLKREEINLLISKDFKSHLDRMNYHCPHKAIFTSYKELRDTDVMISIGGDGTFLESVTLVRDNEIPILGINTGRLGFLATVPNDKIKEGIDAVINGYYSYDERTMISLDSSNDIFGELNFGLNEFTISKRDIASMIIVHTYIDGEFLNSYWADGLIIATPTGSTAYSISVGGPVVLPHSNSFIIAPISPHNLNVRPLIVSDSSVLSFEIEGRNNNFLVSLDSRTEIVEANVQLAVRKSDYKVRLIRMNGENFLNTLRQKLNWGLDTRN
jgi:NAD+ kinase